MTDQSDEAKAELLAYLDPLVEYGFKMLQAGVLKKNVIRHFTNKGLSFEAAENITELAQLRFEKFTHYKNK